MTLMRRPSPFGELLSLRSAMDRLFDETLFRPLTGNEETARAMPLDIYTTADALVIEAALPGVKPEDVEVSVMGDTLTLTATTSSERTEDGTDYLFREVRRGRSSRTVALPSWLRTDDASATFEDGMLHLAIPKAEQSKPHQIRISGTSEGKATAVEAGGTTAEADPSGTAQAGA